MYAIDVAVPLALGILVAFYRAQSHDPLVLRFRWQAGLASMLGLAVLGGILSFRDLLNHQIGPSLEIALVLMACLIPLWSILFLFVSPAALMSKLLSYGPRAAFALAALGTIVGYSAILKMLQYPLTILTGKVVPIFAGLFGLSLVEVTRNQFIHLWHPEFSGQIALPCSGLEGIFFFLFSYLLLRTFDQVNFGRGRTLLHCLLGVVFMFLLNVVRIAAFFGVAIALERHLSEGAGKKFFEQVFHANVGWLLYISGIYVFMSLVYRTSQKNSPPTRQSAA
jgi:exosortase/archaeosortase family protein